MIHYVQDLDKKDIEKWVGRLGLTQIYDEAVNE